MKPCTHCRNCAEPTQKGRQLCPRCLMFQRRYGVPRPDFGDRVLARILAVKWGRPYAV